jgi:bisphosphoglycerate-independent phosphoglycerate mutase (AlkP superfamily)
LERGEALFWDITNQHIGLRGIETPVIAPAEAGRRLAQLGAQHNLTLFECFLPDYAGHNQDLEQARHVISILDSFFAGLFASVEPDITIVVSSDHGNIEDLSQKIHTFNPVPLLVKGPGAAAFADIDNIAQLTPTIIDLLQS